MKLILFLMGVALAIFSLVWLASQPGQEPAGLGLVQETESSQVLGAHETVEELNQVAGDQRSPLQAELVGPGVQDEPELEGAEWCTGEVVLLEGTHQLQELQNCVWSGSEPLDVVATPAWLESHAGLIRTLPGSVRVQRMSPEALQAGLTTVHPCLRAASGRTTDRPWQTLCLPTPDAPGLPKYPNGPPYRVCRPPIAPLLRWPARPAAGRGRTNSGFQHHRALTQLLSLRTPVLRPGDRSERPSQLGATRSRPPDLRCPNTGEKPRVRPRIRHPGKARGLPYTDHRLAARQASSQTKKKPRKVQSKSGSRAWRKGIAFVAEPRVPAD